MSSTIFCSVNKDFAAQGDFALEPKKELFINKVFTWFFRVLTCANCIATNRLQRKTRSHRSEVSHGNYKGNVLLPSCLLLRAKLIVLFITYSVSDSVDRNMAFIK